MSASTRLRTSRDVLPVDAGLKRFSRSILTVWWHPRRGLLCSSSSVPRPTVERESRVRSARCEACRMAVPSMHVGERGTSRTVVCPFADMPSAFPFQFGCSRPHQASSCRTVPAAVADWPASPHAFTAAIFVLRLRCPPPAPDFHCPKNLLGRTAVLFHLTAPSFAG